MAGGKAAHRAALPGLRWRTLALALLVYVLLCGSYFFGATAQGWQKLELLGTVLRFNLRGEQPLDPSIRILGITQQNVGTLADYGEQYPFARDIHAVVLRRLADAGAKVIVVDILFSEEGSWDPAEDAALRNAIRYCQHHGCAVVLAAGIDVGQIGQSVSKHLVKPAPVIMEANPRLGLSNVAQKLSFRLTEQGGFDTSEFGPAGFLDSQPWAAWYALKSQQGIDFKRGGPGRPFMINYACSPERSPNCVHGLEQVFPEMFSRKEWDRVGAERSELKKGEPKSAAVLSDSSVLRGHFAGRVVFYGSRNLLDNDFFNTPFDRMFGMDTIAESFNTILQRKFITSLDGYCLLLIGLIATLLAWATSVIRPLKLALLCGIVLILATVGLPVVLFLQRIDLPLAFTTASFVFPFLACTIYGGTAEEHERRKIRATFSRYMSNELVAQLVEDPKMADLGGQRLDVAVMFCDIRSYSTITEHLEPHTTVQMLNAFLGAMSQVIRRHGGFIDKYLGDGMLVCFGGPVRTPRPAADSVAAALEMLRVLHDEVNPRLAGDGLPELRIGIGIHFGPVVMGNIGSETRMDFTVVGDSVNVAARVETATKDTGWAVLVTREVADNAPEFEFETLIVQKVKGRVQPVEMLRPVDEKLGDLLRL